jgi:dCTP deaminase
MVKTPFESDGIFPDQWLREAVVRGFIDAGELKIPDANFQPASLDLRLGPKAYRLRCSFVSGNKTVGEKLDDFVMGEIDLRDGAILERNRPYLIPLLEELRLPPNVYAKTNPRSSTGRLDIFTRVISDRSARFDEIAPGYHGKLYLEVASRSFTIHVQERVSLNQLRLMTGKYRSSDNPARDFHEHTPIIFAGGQPADASYLYGDNGVFLSIDLAGDENKVVGYKAKKNSYLLDLCAIGEHNVEDFWDPVYPEKKNRLVLEPEEFYLLLSAETVRVPPVFAAEMNAYEPTSGELRTHYAGFFDPGFGYDEQGLSLGSKAVLEVRAHDVPFMIENGQKVCQLEFQAMAEAPTVLYGTDVGSSYQYQELTLSKHFRRSQPQTPAQISMF